MNVFRKLICVILTLLLVITAIIPVAANTTELRITSLSPTAIPAKVNSFDFYIEGSGFGTNESERKVELLDESQPEVNLIKDISLKGEQNSLKVSCKTEDPNGLGAKEYTLRVTIDGQSVEAGVSAIETLAVPSSAPNSNPIPVLKELMSVFLPSGYSNITVRLVGTDFSEDVNALNICLYDSNGSNVLSHNDIFETFPEGTDDRGVAAELVISSSYNNDHGLIEGESYTLVLESDGIESQPITVEAQSTPLINDPISWNITPDATKYYVEFRGYNLQNFVSEGASARLVDYNAETPQVIGETESIEIIEDSIDREHLKVRFDDIDLSGMDVNEFFVFEMESAEPLAYVTRGVGIRISEESYVTSFGYTDRENEYNYNIYGFNLAGDYSLNFTSTSDSEITYTIPFEMNTEDEVNYKANVSIAKDSDWLSGEYNVVIKNASDTIISGRVDYLDFGNENISISGINPEVLPAKEHNFYFYINGSGFGDDSNAVEVQLYDPNDGSPDEQENLINVHDLNAWGDTLRVACESIGNTGLEPGDYTLRVIQNGDRTAELTVSAVDTPVIPYMEPYEIPEGAEEVEFFMEGGNFDVLTSGEYTLELYLKDENDGELVVGNKEIPAEANYQESYYIITVPVEQPDLLINNTKVYYRILGPETVYYGVTQDMTVMNTPIIAGWNYDRFMDTMYDPSSSHIAFEFRGFNLEGEELTADIRNENEEAVMTLEATGEADEQGHESAVFYLPKGENLPEGYYRIQVNESTKDFWFYLENTNMTIAGLNEERITATIDDGMATAYDFEFFGTNLSGRKLRAELKNSAGVVVETLYAVGMQAADEHEYVLFKLPKSKRILLGGTYSIAILGDENEYNFEVSSDSNNYYDIYLNITHDLLGNDYEGLSITLNGEAADVSAIDSNGNFVIEDVVSGMYDLMIKQPKHLSKRITITVDQADSTNNQVILRGGDTNGDDVVDINDLTIMAMSYDAVPIDERADVDNNDTVNILDLTALAINYGKESTGSMGIRVAENYLDPNMIFNTEDIMIANSVYEGLVRVHGPMIQPGMAKNWTISEDGLTYTFDLRDAYWSDGVPVTAYDFEYSILRLLDPRQKAPYAYQGYYILNAEQYNMGQLTDTSMVGVKALNERTLEIKLKAPCQYFLSVIGTTTFAPVREDLVKGLKEGFGHDINQMAFNGPFLPNAWNGDPSRTLKRNPDYWNKKDIYMDRINLYNIVSNEEAADLYDVGVLDMLNLNSEGISRYQGSEELNYQADGSVWYLQININGKTTSTGKFLKNPDFREAISLVIDREAFTQAYTNAGSLPALRYVHPKIKGNENYYSLEKPLSYYSKNAQTAQAEAALTKALIKLELTEIPELELLVGLRQIDLDQARAIQTMLANIGITLNIKQVDFETKMSLMNASQYDLVYAGWGPDYNDPMTYLDLWTSNSGGNTSNWSDEYYDELIDACKTETNLVDRLDKVFEAEQYLLENGPVVPIYFRNNGYVQKKDLQGVIRSLVGTPIDFVYAAKEELPGGNEAGVISPEARICNELGIIMGTGDGITPEYLAEQVNRIQTAAFTLRLTGKIQEAMSFTGTDNFTDADSVMWAKPIMAYLKAHPELGFAGLADGSFNPNGSINGMAYYKIMLTVLGYTPNTAENIGDYNWANMLDFAASKGLSRIASIQVLTINDLAIATVEALRATVKVGDKTLAEELVDQGIIDGTKAQQLGLIE